MGVFLGSLVGQVNFSEKCGAQATSAEAKGDVAGIARSTNGQTGGKRSKSDGKRPEMQTY
jgi:hypothetical protein